MTGSSRGHFSPPPRLSDGVPGIGALGVSEEAALKENLAAVVHAEGANSDAAAAEMKVDFVLHAGSVDFPSLSVPTNCTVGDFKLLIEKGILGDKVLYMDRLKFTKAGCIKTLEDCSKLPESPAKLYVNGPKPVMTALELALIKKVGAPRPKPVAAPKAPQNAPQKHRDGKILGDYKILHSIGTGFEGVCVYAAHHTADRKQVALKWPAKADEVAVLQKVDELAPAFCPGIPRPLAHGMHKGRPYVVTECFGAQLTRFIQRQSWRPIEDKWHLHCIVARMVLRRLASLHKCGFVHCDVSPENILMGRRPGKEAPEKLAAPCLVDFGLARDYPGGSPLRGDYGSSEWSSVRSADGGVRVPEDDIEALGWILVNALLGELPWFQILSKAYQKWHDMEQRQRAVQMAQFTKRQLLFVGWKSMGDCWKNYGQVPANLWTLLLECEGEDVGRPDYSRFDKLLGGTGHTDMQKAEEADLEQFREHVLPLL